VLAVAGWPSPRPGGLHQAPSSENPRALATPARRRRRIVTRGGCHPEWPASMYTEARVRRSSARTARRSILKRRRR
jgi:hypothetical protein